MANFMGDLSLASAFNAATVSLNNATGGTTATGNGTGVDTSGQASAALNCLLIVGAVSGTTPTLNVKVQDSADNSTFTDVTGATFTQVSASNAAQILFVPPCRRYVRTVQTVTGTTPIFNATTAFIFPKHNAPDAFGGFNSVAEAANG